MKRDNASSVKSMRKKSRIHRKEKRKTIKEGLSSITHPAQESYVQGEHHQCLQPHRNFRLQPVLSSTKQLHHR